MMHFHLMSGLTQFAGIRQEPLEQLIACWLLLQRDKLIDESDIPIGSER